MAFHSNTRTIHTWTIDVPDDALAPLESSMDDVEIVLVSRKGTTMRKRLPYADLRRLLGER